MLPRPSPAVILAVVLAAATAARARTIVVDPAGDGDFRAIADAADAARAGDVVRVRPGVYRQSIPLRHSGTADAPITIAAEMPGTVVVTGADAIDGFERDDRDDGPAVWRAPWPHEFAIDRDAAGRAVEHHPADAPLWGRAEQVFVADPAGHRRLRPAGSIGELRARWADRFGDALKPPVKGLGEPFAGAFFADTPNDALYLWLADGRDPNDAAIEASTRDLLIGNAAIEGEGVRHVRVRGIVFRHAATFAQRPAVGLYGSDNVLEDCVVEHHAGQGVAVNGTVRRCLIRGNGSTGGSAVGPGFANEDSTWRGNSWKPIDRGWEAGGAKVTQSSRGTFARCAFVENGGPGLWLDIDVANVTVSGCAFVGNENSGLFVEISRNVTIEDNLADGNAAGRVGDPSGGWSNGGIELAESIDCVVRRNTVAGSPSGLSLREQGPRPIDRHDGPGRIDYHTRGTTIADNLIFATPGGVHLGFWFDNAFFGPHPSPDANAPTDVKYDPAAQGLTIDGNAYVAEGESPPTIQWGVPWRPASRRFESLAAFTVATGFEAGGRVVGPAAVLLETRRAGAPRDLSALESRSLPTWMRESK